MVTFFITILFNDFVKHNKSLKLNLTGIILIIVVKWILMYNGTLNDSFHTDGI